MFRVNSKGKEKTTKSHNISDNSYLDWLPLRESNSILSGKFQEFTFEELIGSPFTELVFEFYYKKEFMLKVSIQIYQTLRTS